MAGEARLLVVTGEGSASGSPDRCDLWLGLEVAAASVGQAISDVLVVADVAVEALHRTGVGAADTQITEVRVDKVRRPPGHEGSTSYVARYGLTVRGRALSEAGGVIAAASGEVGDGLRVDAIRLRFADPESLRSAARRDAVRDARRKAEEIASAAGVTLGKVVRVEHGLSGLPLVQDDVPRPSPEVRAAPTIRGGATTVSARVTMSFEIGD